MQVRDSIARVEAQQQAKLEQERQKALELANAQEAGQSATAAVFLQDSLQPEIFTLENDKIKLHIDGKGGRISLVDLKSQPYTTMDYFRARRTMAASAMARYILIILPATRKDMISIFPNRVSCQ